MSPSSNPTDYPDIIIMYSIVQMKLIFSIAASILLPLCAFGSEPISEAMCGDPISFQACYGATKQQCLDWADESVKECLKSMPPRPAPPQSLDQLADSEFGKWSVLLGHCSEERFDFNNHVSFKGDAQCTQLLSQRRLNSNNDPVLSRARRGNRGLTRNQFLGMMATPILFGIIAMLKFLSWRSRKMGVTFSFGFLSWILFLVAAFFGELLSHFLFPFLYASIGDEPTQVAGLIAAIFASMVLNPIAYLFYKNRTKK